MVTKVQIISQNQNRFAKINNFRRKERVNLEFSSTFCNFAQNKLQ